MNIRQACHRWRSLLGAAAVVAGSLLATPAAAGPYSDAVLAKNPFAYWRMNETSGSTLLDSSGNGRHGIYLGGYTTGVAGPLAEAGNSAVRFTAAQSGRASVTIGDTFGGTGWSNVTIEAWVNLGATTNTYQPIVSAPGTQFALLLSLDSPASSAFYGSAATGPLTSPTVAQLAGWHHLVMTAAPGEQRLYLDGALFSINNVVTGDLVSTSTLLLGGGLFSTYFMNGALDEVAIYRTTLTQAQINQNFQAASQVASTATPEPASLAMLALGVAALGGARRRLRSA